MRRTLLIILFLTLIAPGTLWAKETKLSKIRMASNRTTAQIYITFDEVPRYTEVTKGKRIDIILQTNLTNSEPVPFSADDKVVKFLTLESQKGTILSFFLRYEPQRVSFSTIENSTLVLDILLGNQFTKEYPGLAGKLEGLSVLNREGKDFANPYVASPFTKNWHSFFSRYESDITTESPVTYTNPPFPIIDFLDDGFKSDLLPAEILQLSAGGQWKTMLPIMFEQINGAVDPGIKKHLALVLGEILFRDGRFNDAYKQLYLLKESYPKESVGIAATYLLGRLYADNGSPYKADNLFSQIEDDVHVDFSLSPFLRLSQIETALATNRPDRVRDLLERDDIAFSPRLAEIKKLRLADYWFAIDAYVKAFVSYQLINDKTLLDNYTFSLNGYCNTLYHQKKYELSAQCFATLSSKVEDRQFLGMISQKKAMAELHYKPIKEMYVTFSGLENTYDGSPAGFWAALKKTDIRYLSQPSFRNASVQYYRSIAKDSTDRKVAEEAALKEAIAQFELGNSSASIELLMSFLRNFHASELVREAKALIIEQLPQEIETLLANNDYVRAIVLAKKNREFFQNKWIDIGLLGLLAKAYHELGIHNEARKLYIYLLNTSEPLEKKDYYLPLLSILNSQGYHDLVEDYATEYIYNYPQGAERDKVGLIRLQSLVATGQEQKALSLLVFPLPQMREIREIAAFLYFNDNQFDKTIEILSTDYLAGGLTKEDSLYMLAESYYQVDQFGQAQELYEMIKENEKFFDQARYRLAMIERNSGSDKKSLKLLEEIVEKGYDPLWQKLAGKELEIQTLQSQY